MPAHISANVDLDRALASEDKSTNYTFGKNSFATFCQLNAFMPRHYFDDGICDSNSIAQRIEEALTDIYSQSLPAVSRFMPDCPAPPNQDCVGMYKTKPRAAGTPIAEPTA